MKILKSICQTRSYSTGLNFWYGDDMSLINFTHITKSDTYYGYDVKFEDPNSYLQEMGKRDEVLDKGFHKFCMVNKPKNIILRYKDADTDSVVEIEIFHAYDHVDFNEFDKTLRIYTDESLNLESYNRIKEVLEIDPSIYDELVRTAVDDLKRVVGWSLNRT